MADPPDEAEGAAAPPLPAGRPPPAAPSRPVPRDPPEVGRPPSFELPNWHRAKSRRILAGDGHGHHLEFEVEGLVTPGNGASPRHQFPRRAAPGPLGRCLSFALAVPLGIWSVAWSVAWSPRHRTKSGLCLVLAAFALLVHLELVPGGGGGSLLGARSASKGSGGRRADPLGGLPNEQRLSLLKEVYGTWTFYDGGKDDRPKVPYVTVENAGNRFLDLPEDKFPPESWQADAGETSCGSTLDLERKKRPASSWITAACDNQIPIPLIQPCTHFSFGGKSTRTTSSTRRSSSYAAPSGGSTRPTLATACRTSGSSNTTTGPSRSSTPPRASTSVARPG